MKRGDVIRHLREQGCESSRKGTKHTIFVNPNNGRRSVVSRQAEIGDHFVRAICRQLDIDPPRRR